MRYFFAILSLVMILFAGLQYNDADGLLWVSFYGVPAICAGTVAVRPCLLAAPLTRVVFGLCAAAAIGLTIFYWPPVDSWWREDVWSMAITEDRAAQVAEQAREGMGLMIGTVVILVLLVASFLSRPSRAHQSDGSCKTSHSPDRNSDASDPQP
jgi:hypothetical protein